MCALPSPVNDDDKKMELLDLSNDVLVELLTFSADLATLRALILTHPVLYNAFAPRRRQILRHVFSNQTYDGSSKISSKKIGAAHDYMTFLKNKKRMKPIDSVALREALWPEIRATTPTSLLPKWGLALAMGYQRAGFTEEAIAFARDAAKIPLGKCKFKFDATLQFFSAIIKTLTKAGFVEDAIALHTGVFKRLKHKDEAHIAWARDLVNLYILNGERPRARKFQTDLWDKYFSCLGSEHTTTLSWARLLVKDYQADHFPEKAFEFHKKVRNILMPSKATYIAWSRQTVHMARKLGKEDDALSVIRAVRSGLGPGASGYYAWTKDLIDAYEKAGRNADAISVSENAYTTTGYWRSRNPNDLIWAYKFKNSGQLLLRVYRRHGKTEEAEKIEETFKGLGVELV